MPYQFASGFRAGDPTKSVAVSHLASAGSGEVVPLVDNLVASSPAYDRGFIVACLSSVERNAVVSSPQLDPFLSKESRWWGLPAGLWLVARLLELRGELPEALQAWSEVVTKRWGDLREAQLSRARILGQLNRPQEAFEALRESIYDNGDYTFLAKATKLLTRLSRQGSPPSVRKARIALLSTTTTDLLAPLLRLICFRDEINAEIYVAPYGNLQQEVLNPSSNLYAFRPEVVLICTHWRDAGLPAFSDAPETEVDRVACEFQKLWETLLKHCPCHVIQHNFDLPATDPYGNLGHSLPGGRASMLRELNRRMLSGAPPAVTILDLDHVSAKFGKRAWFDPAVWHLAKQHPSAAALPLLVDHQVALLRAGLGLTRKVLVVDLDNTLWGGIIGEDGLGGITLGPPSALGEAYQAFQQYLRDLKNRGVLLAVCSKNNQEDAKLPFLKHDSMVLRLEDFAAFMVNWEDKPRNLKEIARLLNLGVDSFVFVDDNPAERMLVRRQLKRVAVPEIGGEPGGFVAALDRGLYFEALSLSREDKRRNELYRANALRDELKTTAASLDEFLCNLQMEAEAGPFSDAVLARVVQLIGKTNQFNLTTRRHSEQKIRNMMTSNGCWTQYFNLSDRFGDNGLIGVIIGCACEGKASTWEVDTWLISCRVIGRRIEELMLNVLAETAKNRGIRTLHGVYIPTHKNQIVAELYSKLGFSKTGETEAGGVTFALDLKTWKPFPCPFVRLKHQGTSEG